LKVLNESLDLVLPVSDIFYLKSEVDINVIDIIGGNHRNFPNRLSMQFMNLRVHTSYIIQAWYKYVNQYLNMHKNMCKIGK
jgi:hypothetical protein